MAKPNGAAHMSRRKGPNFQQPDLERTFWMFVLAVLFLLFQLAR